MGPLVRSYTAKLNRFRLHLFLGVALGAAVGFVACGDATTGASDTFPVAGPDSGSYALADGGLIKTDLDASVESLYFDPPSATLTVDGVTTQTASYSLHAKLADGSDKVVAPESLEFDRPDLAQVTSTTSPIVLSTSGPYAGTGTLHAIVGGHRCRSSSRARPRRRRHCRCRCHRRARWLVAHPRSIAIELALPVRRDGVSARPRLSIADVERAASRRFVSRSL